MSTLKTQVTLASGLAIGTLITATVKEPEKQVSFKITAWVLLSFLTVVQPVLFTITLWKNRKVLSKEPVMKKIGALYENFNAEKNKVGTYSIVFLVRRSLFVALTFALFNQSGILV